MCISWSNYWYSYIMTEETKIQRAWEWYPRSHSSLASTRLYKTLGKWEKIILSRYPQVGFWQDFCSIPLQAWFPCPRQTSLNFPWLNIPLGPLQCFHFFFFCQWRKLWDLFITMLAHGLEPNYLCTLTSKQKPMFWLNDDGFGEPKVILWWAVVSW